MTAKTGLVSIIVPCFNKLRFTRMCVNSILKYTSHPYELIVIDNGSKDGTAKYFKVLKKSVKTGVTQSIKRLAVVISKDNLGVSGALNRGVKISKGDYICYLNNDVIVTTGWLEGIVRCAQSDKSIGIVGCSTNTITDYAGLFPVYSGYRNIKEIQRTAVAVSIDKEGVYKKADYVHGLCMFIKRQVTKKIGLFDERFYPCCWEDLDYSYRAAKAGYRLVNAM